MDLSVIIPVCGAGRHIAACLRSVTRCSRENIDMECLVINNDSTCEPSAVVNRYIERDNRIKLIIKEDDSGYDMRNTGIHTASGRYLLFLDADDRLCEDAWEQIEAAVQEEYADFVAFSHITLRERKKRRIEKLDGGGLRITPYESGKLKTQMLPITDVISTDAGEARRLMYADSVLKSCRGKLFKSRIIRDNNIFFRTELLSEPGFSKAELSKCVWDAIEFMFVAEYFEHSESFLLTKAMILYCPPRGSYMTAQYRIRDRMKLIEILYDFHINNAKRYHDSELTEAVKLYFLKLLIQLFSEYVEERCYKKSVVDTLYKQALESGFIKCFLNEVDERRIRSGRRRYEYRLLRQQDAAKLRRYCAVRTGSIAGMYRYF